jgi:hypothetical protein
MRRIGSSTQSLLDGLREMAERGGREVDKTRQLVTVTASIKTLVPSTANSVRPASSALTNPLQPDKSDSSLKVLPATSRGCSFSSLREGDFEAALRYITETTKGIREFESR